MKSWLSFSKGNRFKNAFLFKFGIDWDLTNFANKYFYFYIYNKLIKSKT